jgi:hypothetical protein
MYPITYKIMYIYQLYNQKTFNKEDLLAGDVGRPWSFRSLFDVEFDISAFFEIRTTDIFHVEEHVIVSVFRFDKAVTASVVEEINRTCCHCDYR